MQARLLATSTGTLAVREKKLLGPPGDKGASLPPEEMLLQGLSV